MTITATTRLAIQATSAVMLAVIFSYFFHWERSYWAILTAMLLISQTWGESIKKSIERVVMTILGGITGTLIYFAIGQMHLAVVIVLLIAIFFNIYFTGKSYLLAVFFATILVAFLFANLAGWTIATLEERIVETTVGAIIAVTTTAIVLPMRGKRNLQTILADFILSIEDIVTKTFSEILAEKSHVELKTCQAQLIQRYFALEQQIKLITYELLFAFLPRRKLKLIIIKLGTLVHYITNIMEVVAEMPQHSVVSEFKDELIQAQDILLANFSILHNRFLQKGSNSDLKSLTPVVKKLQTRAANYMTIKTYEKKNMFDFLSLFYYLKKMDELMKELGDILE